MITSTRHVARREEQGLLFVNAQLPKPWMHHLIAGGGQTVWTLHPQSLVMLGIKWSHLASPDLVLGAHDHSCPSSIFNRFAAG